MTSQSLSTLGLTGKTVRLLPYSDRHDAQTVAWLNDPFIKQHFGFSGTATIAEHRDFITHRPNICIWAIVDARNDLHVGNILLHLEQKQNSAYLQMYIGKAEARGRGVGREALNLALYWGFNVSGLHRIWLHVFPENSIAIRLYRTAGFIKEGTERQGIFRDGKYMDQDRYSLLDNEWRDSQQEFQV